MQAGFLRLFARRERDEKEELPLEFSVRVLLNPRMLSCSLNLLQCQFDGAASVAALLRCVKNAGWVVGKQIFLHTKRRGYSCLLEAACLSRNPQHKKAQGAEAVGACSTDVLLNISSFCKENLNIDLLLQECHLLPVE